MITAAAETNNRDNIQLILSPFLDLSFSTIREQQVSN